MQIYDAQNKLSTTPSEIEMFPVTSRLIIPVTSRLIILIRVRQGATTFGEICPRRGRQSDSGKYLTRRDSEFSRTEKTSM